MTALLAPWPLLCIGLWTAIVGTLILFGHRLEKIRPTVAEPEPEVVRLDWLPPVPPPTTPPTQADIDATWLDAWPTEARWAINTNAMEQARYDRLFDDLIAIEGLQ